MKSNQQLIKQYYVTRKLMKYHTISPSIVQNILSNFKEDENNYINYQICNGKPDHIFESIFVCLDSVSDETLNELANL